MSEFYRAEFEPHLVVLDADLEVYEAIDSAEHELRAVVHRNSHAKPGDTGYEGSQHMLWGCFGDRDRAQLPSCDRLYSILGAYSFRGLELPFRFVRYAELPQRALIPGSRHLDRDPSNGIGELEGGHVIVRAMFNFSTVLPRVSQVSRQNPQDPGVQLENRNGLPTSVSYDSDKIVDITLPPREETKVHGFVFAASHVLHGGSDNFDDMTGHFVGSFGATVTEEEYRELVSTNATNSMRTPELV